MWISAFMQHAAGLAYSEITSIYFFLLLEINKQKSVYIVSPAVYIPLATLNGKHWIYCEKAQVFLKTIFKGWLDFYSATAMSFWIWYLPACIYLRVYLSLKIILHAERAPRVDEKWICTWNSLVCIRSQEHQKKKKGTLLIHSLEVEQWTSVVVFCQF